MEEKTIFCLICRLKIIGYLHVLDIGNTEGKLVGVEEYQVPVISFYRKIQIDGLMTCSGSDGFLLLLPSRGVCV